MRGGGGKGKNAILLKIFIWFSVELFIRLVWPNSVQVYCTCIFSDLELLKYFRSFLFNKFNTFKTFNVF